jgi:flagellar protein FlaG
MSNFNTDQPEIRVKKSEDYREGYANSVQIRMSVWDFFVAFGKALPGDGPGIDLVNFQGIYLSPQQAKALSLMLQQNVANYEQTFGEIKLDPQFAPNGPIH